MAYTHKIVNGVLQTLTPTDTTVLAARDTDDWSREEPVVVTSGTAAERVARLLKAHGLTLAEFKTTLGI